MKILHVGYGFRPFRGGGLITYSEDLMQAQVRLGHKVAYFCAGRYYGAGKKPIRKRWIRQGVTMYEIVNPPVIHGGDLGTLKPRADLEETQSEVLFRRTLEEFRPDVVHIQQLSGLPSSLIGIAKNTKIPVLMTLQDYYMLCPTLKLYDQDRRTCLSSHVGERCVMCCQNAYKSAEILAGASRYYDRDRLKSLLPSGVRRFLKLLLKQVRGPGGTRVGRSESQDGKQEPRRGLPAVLGAEFQARRDRNVEHLNQVDLLIAQSHRVKEIYKILGVDESRMRTMQLTLAHMGTLKRNNLAPISGPINFATLNGCINPKKGAEVISGALKILHEKNLLDSFRLFVWGGLEDGTRKELDGFPNVIQRSWYSVDQLDSMLESVHVGLVPSTWEEAYAFVGVEFLAKGIPVIGNAIGGIVDYTKPGVTGWLNYTNDADGLADIMAQLIRNPREIEQMHRSITSRYHEIIKPMARHCEEMIEVYQDLLLGRSQTDQRELQR
jgi:glycosyltransferase involved in cell wall biosynthesis